MGKEINKKALIFIVVNLILFQDGTGTWRKKLIRTNILISDTKSAVHAFYLVHL
jgi:hypothetical protein